MIVMRKEREGRDTVPEDRGPQGRKEEEEELEGKKAPSPQTHL